jgi:sugar phosphate isomerase/epimerase
MTRSIGIPAARPQASAEASGELAAEVGPELVLSVLTLRNATFAHRVLAAAAAGFTGIGLGAADYLDARRAGFSEEQLGEYVARHDLRVMELEFLRDWWAEADTRGARLEEDLLFYLADLLGADQIDVGLFDHVPDDLVDVAFRRLCARAADHGLKVALEFMPYSALRTLQRARQIVSDSGAPNAGLILDTWHWHRAGGRADGAEGGNIEELLTLDAAEVFSIQLNDARPQPHADLRHEGRHLRLLPGEGVIDLTGFLGALQTVGVQVPISVEVLSDDLDTLSPVEAARRAVETTRRVLAFDISSAIVRS